MNPKIISTSQNLQVLYEDNHIIAINKRPGDIVQGDKTGDVPLSELVKAYISVKYNKPGKVYLGVVHRLDRPTSGIVVFARTSKATTRLNKLFKEKQIKKTYWAIVEGLVTTKQKTLTHYLVRNPTRNKSYAHDHSVSDSKLAILHFSIVQLLQKYTLLTIDLETGRHHQIRSQLSKIGYCIKGDLKYGAKRSNPDGSICLHARSIEFIHPVKKEHIQIVASPPTLSIWQNITS
ncbi:RluA family pseudouridine synthase [Aquimarina sp. ERC-38]|uniref:RluA family pseudouridine synthase n=1 Tax=Aquimarina sp. ERC-38 TaxID=2949996 RepID=UPI0022451911|nr:RluA family pseudouridine synthase [Aquimarina sp. ERC-38]UZO79855.1 RluA family pseudouridine synthase [Aquimarina sp. ERC-38]